MSIESNHAEKVACEKVKPYGRLVLLAPTGSRAYGTDHADSDYDFKGVYIADKRALFSLSQPPKTIDLKEPHDIVLYELGHFCKLAAAANPTVLEILYAPDAWASPSGHVLQDCRGRFLSKRVLKTYGGYAVSQLEKARKGVGGSRGVEHFVRPKFKLHTLRLLDAGIHALRTGEVLVRHPNPAQLVADAEAFSMDQMENVVKAGFAAMDLAAASSLLPDEPSEQAINALIYKLRMP